MIAGYTTTTTYNADDQATLVTDPVGNATLTCYDGDGNAVQTVPPAGVAANSLTAASCPSAYPAGYGTRLASDATTVTSSDSKIPERSPSMIAFIFMCRLPAGQITIQG